MEEPEPWHAPRAEPAIVPVPRGPARLGACEAVQAELGFVWDNEAPAHEAAVLAAPCSSSSSLKTRVGIPLAFFHQVIPALAHTTRARSLLDADTAATESGGADAQHN